jgi:hypothetical protein
VSKRTEYKISVDGIVFQRNLSTQGILCVRPPALGEGGGWFARLLAEIPHILIVFLPVLGPPTPNPILHLLLVLRVILPLILGIIPQEWWISGN